MKTFLRIALAGIITGTLPAFRFTAGTHLAGKPLPQRVSIAELVKHQWTIAEYTETINDTARNITLAMMPCEKEQVLKYEPNNTYLITEGAIKCNAGKPVKENGTWRYVEADNNIVEVIGSGREIEKKIISLDEGLLKIQYEGEAKKIITITYLSELGKKDEAKKDQFVDNADPISYITQMIRATLIELNNCTLVSLADFTKGVNKKSSAGRVVVVPLLNMTDDNNLPDVREEQDKLIAQGKTAGIDFIVTGVLVSLKKEKLSDNKVSTRIKYRVEVLNVKEGKVEEDEVLAYPEEKNEQKKKKWSDVVKKTAGIISDVAPAIWIVPALRGNGSNALGNLYTAMYASQAASTAAGMSTVFSDNIGSAERKENFEASLSVMQAIESTQPALNSFLDKKNRFKK